MSHPPTTSRYEGDADALTVESLRKRFAEHQVLDDVTLRVARGECVAVLGPSGCGKSTLLRIVAGLESADEGRVSIAGTVTDDPKTRVPAERRGVALVFQDLALWPHMTVRQSLEFVREAAYSQGRTDGPEIDAAAASVGLAPDLLARKPGHLSGGERQRAALARALVQRPAVLLLDEPLTGLDRHLRVRLTETLRTARSTQGLATLLVTHDHEEAFALADRVAVMHEGRLVQVGTPEEIYRTPSSRFVAEFVGRASCVAAEVEGDEWVTPVGRFAGAAGARPGIAVLRPEQVRAETDEDGSGSVRDSIYRGGSWTHRIALGNGEDVLARDSRYLPVGTRVRITAAEPVFLPGETR